MGYRLATGVVGATAIRLFARVLGFIATATVSRIQLKSADGARANFQRIIILAVDHAKA